MGLAAHLPGVRRWRFIDLLLNCVDRRRQVLAAAPAGPAEMRGLGQRKCAGLAVGNARAGPAGMLWAGPAGTGDER